MVCAQYVSVCCFIALARSTRKLRFAPVLLSSSPLFFFSDPGLLCDVRFFFPLEPFVYSSLRFGCSVALLFCFHSYAQACSVQFSLVRSFVRTRSPIFNEAPFLCILFGFSSLFLGLRITNEKSGSPFFPLILHFVFNYISFISDKICVWPAIFN